MADVRLSKLRVRAGRQARSCESPLRHMTDTSLSKFAIGGSEQSQLTEEPRKIKIKQGREQTAETFAAALTFPAFLSRGNEGDSDNQERKVRP